MTDLIQRLVNAVVRQEGKPADYLNPGDLRGAPWLAKPIINLGFWCPSSRNEGMAGLAHLVALHLAQGNTLRDFVAGHPGIYAGFAPARDHNDPETYIANVMNWAAIPDSDVPLWNYIA